MRLLAVLVAASLLVLASIPAPASAHGGAQVTVHSDGHGSVWLTARWQDGHPVTDPIRATLTATSTRGSVGPVDLQPRGDVLAYDGALAAGSWHVVVQVFGGQCQATVPVSSPARVVEVACLLGSTPPPAPSSFPLWTLSIPLVAVLGYLMIRWWGRRSAVGRAG